MTPDQVGLVIADRFLSEEYSGRDNLALHISSAINQAMADERERCARIVEIDNLPSPLREQLQAAIRKVGQA